MTSSSSPSSSSSLPLSLSSVSAYVLLLLLLILGGWKWIERRQPVLNGRRGVSLSCQSPPKNTNTKFSHFLLAAGQPYCAMSLFTLVPAVLLALFAVLPSIQPNTLAYGSALTTTVQAHERSCFYAWVDKEGEKVGFYFAVSSPCLVQLRWPSYLYWCSDTVSSLGTIWRVLRHRLGHHRSERYHLARRRARPPGRLHLHRPKRRRVLVLLLVSCRTHQMDDMLNLLCGTVTICPLSRKSS